MKNILIFINSMKTAGGIERVVANLANVWSKKYNVTILVKDECESFYELNENIKIQSLNSPLRLNMHNRFQRVWSLFLNIINSRKKIKRYLKENQFDYIYVTSPFNSLLLYLSSKSSFKKLIISEHGSELAYNKVYKILKKYLYPKAYSVSVPTTLDTESYLKQNFNAIYIPHLSTFQKTLPNKLDTKIVLNIGRLTSDKQQILLLKIWNELHKDNDLDGWRLIIVGKGEEEKKLRDYISLNKLENVVEIMEPTKNIELVYKEASIFAFTSRYEGFGMVLLEAMSYGIPCVSFDCPSGPRDIVKDNINGFLVPCYDAKIFKEKLLCLMKNDEKLIYFGKNAYRIAEQWDNEKIINKWDYLFS